MPFFLLCVFNPAVPSKAHAQDTDTDALRQRDVDALRDAAFVPIDRIRVFEGILNDREKQLDDLLAHRQGHTEYPADMHDLLDQIGSIADELNDNLDEYSKHHRDVRKALPKLLEDTGRWSEAIGRPAPNDAYNIVRRTAVDNLKDTHDLAAGLQTDLDAYFKAHPEAAKEEKRRNGDPHAVENTPAPR